MLIQTENIAEEKYMIMCEIYFLNHGILQDKITDDSHWSDP